MKIKIIIQFINQYKKQYIILLSNFKDGIICQVTVLVNVAACKMFKLFNGKNLITKTIGTILFIYKDFWLTDQPLVVAVGLLIYHILSILHIVLTKSKFYLKIFASERSEL